MPVKQKPVLGEEASEEGNKTEEMDGEEEGGSSDDEGRVKTLAEVDFSSSDSEEELGELVKG